jgi:transposase-like protein
LVRRRGVGIKGKGEWKLYRAVDKAGDIIDFLLRAYRGEAAARSFFEQAIEQNGALEKVTIDRAARMWRPSTPLTPNAGSRSSSARSST